MTQTSLVTFWYENTASQWREYYANCIHKNIVAQLADVEPRESKGIKVRL